MAINAATLSVKVGADVSGATSTLRSFGASVGGMLSNAIGTAGGIALEKAISGVVGAIGGVGSMALTSYASVERLGMSLNSLAARDMVAASGGTMLMADALAQTKGQAQETIKWIQKLSIESPFTSEDVSAAFRTAMAYGFTTDQAKRLTKSMLDFAAGSGTTSEAMKHISLALGQISAKGKVSGQELNQLSEAGINMRAILAKEFGVTTAEIMKMTEQGLIPADRAIQALVTNLEEGYGGAGLLQANTFSGLISSVQELQALDARALFGGIFEAAQPALVKLVAMMQDPAILKTLQNMGNAMGQSVGHALDWAVERLDLFFLYVKGGEPIMASFAAAFNLNPMAIQINNALGWLEKLMTALNDLTYQLYTWDQAVGNVGAGIHDWIGAQWNGLTGRNDAGITLQGSAYDVPSGLPRPKPVSLGRVPVFDPMAPGAAYGASPKPPGATGFEGYGWDMAAPRAVVEAWTDASFTAGDAMVDAVGGAAESMVDSFEGALGQIPGLGGTSKVTESDMAKAAAGLSVNYADDYVRQAKDELLNGVDWADIDPTEVAQSLGLDPGLPAQIIYDELEKQWSSGQYFANPENLSKVNWQAMRDQMAVDAQAAFGHENLVAEAMKQSVTPESFGPLATDTVAMTTAAIVSATATPEAQTALEAAGVDAYKGYYAGWVWAANGAPIVPPGGTPPPTPPSDVIPPAGVPTIPIPISFPSAPVSTAPISLPGDGVSTGGGSSGFRSGVTIYATVAKDYDLEKVARRVAAIQQENRRRF